MDGQISSGYSMLYITIDNYNNSKKTREFNIKLVNVLSIYNLNMLKL